MWNAFAMRLVDGSLAVLSAPPSPGEGEVAELEALGQPSVLLAPNHYHNLGLRGFVERYPSALAVSTAKARPRLLAKTGVATKGIEALAERLPPGVRVLVPPGTRQGEAWLRFATPTGVAWLVTDAFFNVTPLPQNPFGWFLWLTRGAPGLRIGGTFLAVGLADRREYYPWLAEQLLVDQPTTLLTAHGEASRDPELWRELGEIARGRLGG